MYHFIFVVIATIAIALYLRRKCEDDAEVVDKEEKFEFPCYDAPCVRTCPKAASWEETEDCNKFGCRHWHKHATNHCNKGNILEHKDCIDFIHGDHKNESCETYKKIIKRGE